MGPSLRLALRGCASPIHVEKGDAHGKWWLDPLEVAYSKGFKAKELRRIRELVFAHRLELKEKWDEHFER